MLMEGKGVSSPLFMEAALHLKKASDEGVPQAHHCLALLYEYGRGVAQDFTKATELYQRAIEESQSESMYNLALMHAYGRGVPQDFSLARSLLEKAAALDHAPAIYYIGVFKFYGYGCEVNYQQALNWFSRALSLGDDRVFTQAQAAAEEIRKLLEQADEHIDRVVNSYHERNEYPLD